MADRFSERGWARFPFEESVRSWATFADQAALKAEADPHPDMLRCDGTWFVGVNALANDETGRLPGGPALIGAAIDAAWRVAGRRIPLDMAQE